MRPALGAALIPLLFLPHADAPFLRGAERAGNSAVTVEITGMDSDVLQSITPAVAINITRGDDDPAIVAVGLRVASNADLSGAFLVDTAVAASGSTVVQLRKPLPSGAGVFLQAFARTATGVEIRSPVTSRKTVPLWLTLLSPNASSGGILASRQPTFTWAGAAVSSPPGPWIYEFSVNATAGGPAIYSAVTQETAIMVPFLLELNTSYRWAVTARLQDGTVTTVQSRSSFVIVDETVPRTTLLHQTFPNPFPSRTAQVACIWFDLAAPSQVLIEVLDIRAKPVRLLYPDSPFAPAQLPAGRYGRAINAESGCTGEYIWDGTDELGRTVSPGVYILRMRSAGRDHFQRMVFRGR